MKTNHITKMTARCDECGTTITFPLAAGPLSVFRCPTCGRELSDAVDRAVRAALAYNRAAAEAAQCQQETGIAFLAE